MDAGLDLPHAAGQGLLALVEPTDVASLAGEFALAVIEFDVAAHRHPVADIFGEQGQPFVVTPLVQEIGLAVEEILDLLLQERTGDAVIAVGGTGAGTQDDSVEMLARAGSVDVHGFGLSPGETSALAHVGAQPVLLLPARLDAALGGFLIVGDALLRGLTGAPISPGMPVTLARKIVSTVGLAEVVPVRVTEHGAEPLASGHWPMQALMRADGWVLAPPESEGFAAGTTLEMRPFP